MRFDYEGDEYDIRFYYEWVHSKATKQPIRQTRCTISAVDPDRVGRDRYALIISTHVTQHIRDQFCRRTGRKEALRNAISLFMASYVKSKHGTIENKMVRCNIWNAYFEDCDKKVVTVNKKDFKEKLYQQNVWKDVEADILV